VTVVALSSPHGLQFRTGAVTASMVQQANTVVAPSVFVAVFSFRRSGDRRNTFRQAWRSADWSSLAALDFKFVICNAGSDGQLDLRNEVNTSGDIVLLPCEDGSKSGQITQKLVLALDLFSKNYPQKSAFMKIEDDAFVPWRRLIRFITQQPSVATAFMGMPIPAGRLVNRDSASPWYQPATVYPNSTYPTYMARPGYLIGGRVVKTIVDNGIARNKPLSNEDQAAGVWVHTVASMGVNISYVTLPGRDGFDKNDQACLGTWAEYTHLIHHSIKPEFHICLARLDGADRLDENVKDCFTDSMFVAIFSQRSNRERRHAARAMLKNAHQNSAYTVAKFILCSPMDASLAKENETFRDMVSLDCEEGYSRTMLTNKLIQTMTLYLAEYADRKLFMKMDDDTFVSWRRLHASIATQATSSYGYMGIRSPPGTQVNRNPNSTWYQPFSTYPNATYPMFMEGGSGYIIGYDLVRHIVDGGVAKANILSNEDQAAGVWLDQLKQQGVQVSVLDIAGTDGYKPENDICFGTWGDYPYVLHHKLKTSSVECLAHVDAAKDDALSINACFDECERTTHSFIKNNLNQLLSTEVQGVIGTIGALRERVLRVTRAGQFLRDRNEGSVRVDGSDVERTQRIVDSIEEATASIQEIRDRVNEFYQHAVSSTQSNATGRTGNATKANVTKLKTSKQHPLIFIDVPRNAGTAIEETGTQQGVWWPRKFLSFWQSVDMPGKSRCDKYHVPPQYLETNGDRDADIYKGGDTFCVARHPYERAISEYLYMLSVEWGPSMSTQDDTGLLAQPRCTKAGLNYFIQRALTKIREGQKFIHDCHFVPQVEYVWGKDGHQWCQHVFRSDALPGALDEFMALHNYSIQLNAIGNKHNDVCPDITTESLGRRTKRMLDEVYVEDFRRLNFSSYP
jgi:hypothetical protein